MKTKLITLTISLLLFTAAQVVAHQHDANKTSHAGLTINEDNLTCFKSLDCIQKENFFDKSHFDVLRNSNSQYSGYKVEGFSEHEELIAKYDHRGNLIRSTVIQRNIPLPDVIRRQLVSEEFYSWNMIGNERVITNFDNKSIEYKLILQQGDEIRVVYFDYKGQNKNRLA